MNSPSLAIAQKLERLQHTLRDYGNALVCFSGGVDSTFLLKIALEVLGDRCYALTALSPTMARSEQEDARALGQELGLGSRHVVIQANELARPGYAENHTDRCYLCKSELLDLVQPLVTRYTLNAVLLGTNVDDLGDYRPGLRAADERQARHPLVEAGLTKQEIRQLSQQLGLRTWNKPQLACLSSRFPYGTAITTERLERIDRFEEGLRALGFATLRVRYHEKLARIELDPADLPRAVEPTLRQQITDLGRSLGFTYVALDLLGYRSGAMNEVLVPLSLRP